MNDNFQEAVEKVRNINNFNNCCADCLSDQSEWASINLGVFVCINCSSVHRSLGTHISQVKSVQLDEWSKSAYQNMLKFGNLKANAYWECNLFPFEKPLAHDSYEYRKRYIAGKYVKKLFVPSEENTKKMVLEREFDVKWASKKGYLTKMGDKRRNWLKRYFVLHDGQLSYFAKESDSYPKGKLSLEAASTVVFVDEIQVHRKYCFAIIISGRNFYIHADTEDDLNDWVYAVRASIYFVNLQKILHDPRNKFSINETSFISKKGPMTKQGGKIKTMKNRFFVLENGALSYYKSEKDMKDSQGIIQLKDAKVSRLNKKKGELGISVHTKDRQFYFIVTSEKEQKDWLDALIHTTRQQSDEFLIGSVSIEIHRLVLADYVHGDKLYESTTSTNKEAEKVEKQKANEIIPYHSPIRWKCNSFHRSHPKYGKI